MIENKEYVTVRIPKFFDDLINKYIELHKEEMKSRGLRTSRAGVVKEALYEMLEREGIIPETYQKIPATYSKLSKEMLFAHAIVKTARGEKLPSNHTDLNYLKNFIRQLVKKKARKNDIKMKEEQLEALVEELLQYHKRLLEMLTMMNE